MLEAPVRIAGFWGLVEGDDDPRSRHEFLCDGSNADRRDLFEIMTAEARYFDRVFEETGAKQTRGEFIEENLDQALAGWGQGLAEEPDRTFFIGLMAIGAEILAELDPADIYGWLSDLKASARERGGAFEVVARAARALEALVSSELGAIGWKPDITLTDLLRFRELVRLLDELLVSILRHRAWLEHLSLLLAESFSEGEAQQEERPAVAERGPPPLVLLSAVQPHAPPGRFFSAPRCESVEMCLSRAREGLMAA